MLILPIHEHGMCFHLFVSSSVSFFSVYRMYRSFTSLVWFIPRYFIVFESVVNGIVYLISLSVSLSLDNKNATDSWISILYPITLLNLFISSSSSLVESLGFCMYSIMLSANRDSLYFFPIWMPFISSCLIGVARISSTMLSKKSESGHPCLVPNLKGNVFLHVGYDAGSGFVIYGPYYVEVCSLCS